MFAHCRFCVTKWLTIGVHFRLTEVSTECRSILQKIWEEHLGTQGGIHLAPLKILLASILWCSKESHTKGPFKDSESLLLVFLAIFVIVKTD